MAPYKILVTGDRNWTDERVIREVLTASKIPGQMTVLIHGGATGADAIAARVGSELGFTILAMPANWNDEGKGAGPKRNARMVAMKPQVCFVFHDDLKNSKGTKDCTIRALKAGILCLRFKQGMPSNAIEFEQSDKAALTAG